MKTKSKIIITLIILILIFVIAWHFTRPTAPSSNKPTTIKPTTVSVMSLRMQVIPQQVRAYGNITSPRSATIASKTNGVIIAINFSSGQAIKKGQQLFQIRSNDINSQLEQLKSKMLTSKAHFIRFRDANASLPGTISREDLQTAEADYQQDLAAYSAAKDAAFLVSPIDGVVSATNIAVGNSVTAGEALVTVVDSTLKQVEYELPSKYSKQIKVGQSITFIANNNSQALTGTVSYISPQLGADENLTLHATLQNSSDLRPNQSGEVIQIINPNFRALVIPQALVQSDTRGFFVFVLQIGKVSKQYFQPGMITIKGEIEVKSGLTSNAQIISSDPTQLSVGEKVQVKKS